MAFDFRALKAEKKPLFHKNFREYYPCESLEGVGFQRRECSCCGRGFWANTDRELCDEPLCNGGYRFIGKRFTKKQFSYKEAWDEYVKTFEKWDYKPIKRYPVVCRWYEDLYFVNAGINDFQPYVVSGEVEPPAPAVLEPQFCLRFSDIDSVGITGRHYTGFIMVGQHTFNTDKHHVYFKDEGILQMHEFLTDGLGISDTEIVYHEDVWAGGGNYGPSMEFFVGGLEMGNQVYMQYELLPDGSSRELKTRVIDMGAGLERWSWLSTGSPMSYDSTFPQVMDYLYKRSAIKVDDDFMTKFGHYSGLLDIDDVDDIDSVWGKISVELGLELGELRHKVYELRALYAIADHTRSLLVSIHDGALPSNVGGGYNLRTLLRRCWSLNDEFNLGIELEKVFETHVGEFGKWYTELQDTGSLYDILAEEQRRYIDGQSKGRKLLERESDISVGKMVELYDSHGISPDVIAKVSGTPVPDNFYRLVEARHEKNAVEEESKPKIDLPDGLSDTVLGYYEDQERLEFSAKVLAVFDDKVVLDKSYFYPEGGGQETDNGHIKGKVVTYVEKVGRVIVHTLDDVKGIDVGDTVDCVLDDERRFQLMQHHTATHLVNAASGAVLGPHIWQAGAHKSVRYSRLDITHYKGVTREELAKIEDVANSYVQKKAPVNVSWMKRNDAEEKYGMRLYQGGAVPGIEIRVINVQGIDVEACGGTHLKNTSEVGTIKMLSAKRIQDGVVRLEFTAGGATDRQSTKEDDLFGDCMRIIAKEGGWILEMDSPSDIQAQLERAKDVLKIQSITQIPKTLEKFLKDISQIERELEIKPVETPKLAEGDVLPILSELIFSRWKNLNKQREKRSQSGSDDLRQSIEGEFNSNDVVKFISDGLSVKAASELAKDCVSESGRLLILVNRMGDKVNVVVASSSAHNAGAICKSLCMLLGGGGGGKADLAIGGGTSEDLEAKLEGFSI